MYSYEDRIRAVRLYIKLGKRIAATIRRLGYPTKNSLKAWHREFEQRHDLRTSYVRSTPKYSIEQKLSAVDHYLRISDEGDRPFRDRDRRFRQRDRPFRERDRADRTAGLALRMTSTTRVMLAGFGRRDDARAPDEHAHDQGRFTT